MTKRAPPKRPRGKVRPPPAPAKRAKPRKLSPKAPTRSVLKGDLEEVISAKIEKAPLHPPTKKTPPHVAAIVERAIARSEGRELPEPEAPDEVPYSKKSKKATLMDGTILSPAEPDGHPRLFSPTGRPVRTSSTGRPSSFKEEYIDQAERLCSLGLTDEEIAKFFGVTVRTLYRWKGQFPRFCQAIKTGGEEANERVERSLYKRAVGYEQVAVKIFMPAGADAPIYARYIEQVQPDTTAAIFWLKNRRKEAWRDVSKHEHTGKDGEPLVEQSPETAELDRARRLALLLARGAEAKQRDVSTKH